MTHLPLGAACFLDRHLQRRARTNSDDGPKRIDIQGKWWHTELFMTEVAPEWPARASNCARCSSGGRSADRQRLVALRWTAHRLAHRYWV